MTEIVGNIQSVYTIVLALAIAEAFNQAIKESKPHEESHATTFSGWFDCFHHSRFVSLVVFLLIATPFFQGNQKYLYLQYIEPLHRPDPPRSINARWLDFDCLVFSMQAGMFFVMSRSLSARRWQQFYGAIVVLLLGDFAWVLLERGRGAAIPAEWVWFDIIAAGVLAAIIVGDWFLMRGRKDGKLNAYGYWAASGISIAGLVCSYFWQLEYLIN